MKVFRPLLIVFGLFFLVSLITALELYYIKLPTVDMTTRFVLIGVLTINIMALLTLMFFVGKNLFRLYVERRHKVLGYRFRTKLMIIFGILILIPSLFLFIAASGLATNYINRIFSPQMKKPLSQSIELARSFYDLERDRVLTAARRVSRGEQPFASQPSIRRYTRVPADAPDIVRDAFKGKEGVEVITSDAGDRVRAAVPDRSKGNKGGVVVAEEVLPKVVSERAGKLKELYEDYLKLEAFKQPLRLNYMLILGFVTLLLVFTGLWVSLKISGGITVPIQSLAMATERVAAGDLEVQVTAQSEDEIGLLISSFNQMVRQLSDSKASLEKAYEELDKRRLYLENILENINSGVLFLDGQGRIITINQGACSILHVEYRATVGKDYREFIEGLHSKDLMDMVRDMEGKEIRGVTREVRISINGRVTILRVYVSGIRESYTSKALGILVVFDDLTEVIKAQKVVAWQEMARRLAHEIKNPLTPIKLSTERLIKKWHQKDEHFDAVFEKSTKIIITEVESLRRLVDVFSRYGKMPEMHKTPTSLAALIDSVVALYKGYSDVEITVSVQDGVPLVNLDGEQFKRALINIIDNAVKVMNAKGVMEVSVRDSEGSVMIDIADSGPGIKDEEKEKLFLPYFSKTKGGTGLGLAIANNIVTDHRGRILVRDNKPRGSVFTVEIPISQ